MDLASVILAAGYGTRMKSKLPKVLHSIAGRTLVEWSINAVAGVSNQSPVVVIGHGGEQVQALLGNTVAYAVQSELLGTGHAVMQAQPHLEGKADAVLVVYADMPLLQEATLHQLVTLFEENRKREDLAIAMLTVERVDPQGFGRVVRDDQGHVRAIVEEADCTPSQRKIQELNTGIYCFDADWLWANLSRIPLSAKGEYYLTDLIHIATEQGRRVLTAPAPLEEVYGVNTRSHLATAASVLYQRIAERHMLAGVTLIDPRSTFIDADVEIGQDTVIMPGCVIQGETRIGQDCVIGPHSTIVDSILGDGCRVVYSMVENARMDAGSEIGPFGHLRKGAHLGEGVHMGNFGEVKNSYLGPGTKMGHFSYVGDAEIGADVNIGAGTITCNYDGANKHRTVIEDGVFIGSDTMLVAPVHLGRGARTGAGSVVTHNVAPDTLVLGVPARPKPQVNAEDEPPV